MSCVIAVCAPPDPPAQITSPAARSVNENAVLAHPLTANETVTWEIFGGPDAAKFEIVGSTLRWIGNGAKDFENPDDANGDNVYQVTVTAYDAGFNATSQNISITVLDVDDVPPTITSSPSASVAENAALAHLLTANETVSWAIVGGADQSKFELSGNTLRWTGNGTKDFEAPDDSNLDNAYVVTVRATDTASNTNSQTVTVTVTDVVEVTWLTFKDGTNTNVTLSNNDIAINPTTTATAMGLASTGYKNSGKWYFEVTATKVGSTNDGFGIAAEGATIANVQNFNYTMNCIEVTAANGHLGVRGRNTSSNPYLALGAILTNDVTFFALDLDNWLFWIRKVISGPITWSTTDKSGNIALSNGNLTAATNSGSWGTARSLSALSTGKRYFEFTTTLTTIPSFVGLVAANAALPVGYNAANGSAGLDGLGAMRINGSTVTGSIGSLSPAGSKVRCAVDLDAKLIWFEVIGSGAGWNGNIANNPATGVGGRSIAGMALPAAPFFTGGANGDSVTVNFGASAFTGAVPAGFTAWNAGVALTGWNNSASADPATAVGGIDVSYFSQTRLAPMGMFIAGSIVDPKWTYNFGASPFVATPPAGFTPGWTTGAHTAIGHPTYAYLNTRTTAGDGGRIELGDRLVAFSTPADVVHVGLADFKRNGKFYIECQVSQNAYTFAGFGFVTDTVTTADSGIGDVKQMAVVDWIGRIWSNNTNSGVTIGTPVADGWIGAAIDLFSQRVWFRMLPTGNWNGGAIGVQNPALNLGGVGFGTFNGKTLGPAVWLSGITTFQSIINTGERPFVGAVPAGFTSGWPRVTPVTTNFTSWSPTDKYSTLTLSNNNLTANASPVSAYGAVRAMHGKTSGKYYIEGVHNWLGNPSANLLFGIASGSHGLNQYLGSGNQSGGLDGAGNIQGVGGGTGGDPGTGDIISLAVDVDNKQVWWRVQGGNWNNNAANDPGIGAGGKTFVSFIGPVFPAYNGGFGEQKVFTVNFGDSPFTYPVPAGFTAGWPKNVATMLTVVDNNGVIGNAGTSITVSSSSGGARAASSIKSSGKYYFEVVYNNVVSNSTGAGLTATGVSSTVITGTVVDALAVFKTTGNIWIDGANSGTALGAFGNGQLIGYAIDLDNKRAWLRLGGTGNWNNNISANPATNTGGLNISGLPDACPAGYCAGAADVMTFNFGASAFTGTPPAGFNAGWLP